MNTTLNSLKITASRLWRSTAIFPRLDVRLVAVALLVLTVGCDEQEDEHSPLSSQQMNLAVVNQFFTDLQARDSTAVFNRLADEVTVTLPLSRDGSPNPTVFTGKSASQAYLRNIFQLFSQVRFKDITLTAAENGEMVFAEMQGDFVSPLNSNPYRNVYIFKFQLQQGNVVRITEYLNPVTAAVYLGQPVGPCNNVLCR